jgi:acyl-coenzyme A thioesterase PaaI-like protein
MNGREQIDPNTFGTDQRCFGCGPNNPVGMRLTFHREGDEVVTTYRPKHGFEGPPNVFHGGLQATVADEIAGWALVGLLGRMGFTTTLNVRYVRPLRIDADVTARASIASRTGNFVTVNVRLLQDGKVGAMGRITYMLPDADKVSEYLGGNCPDEWTHLFVDE